MSVLQTLIEDSSIRLLIILSIYVIYYIPKRYYNKYNNGDSNV